MLICIFFWRGENVMNRISRTTAAAALSAALLIAAVPAVQARTLDRHPTSQPAAGWFDATLTWLADVFAGAPQGQARSPQMKTSSYPIGSGGYAVPMTGSCIDPWGNATPCAGGGGGGM
jgi:hypothetical protein